MKNSKFLYHLLFLWYALFNSYRFTIEYSDGETWNGVDYETAISELQGRVRYEDFDRISRRIILKGSKCFPKMEGFLICKEPPNFTGQLIKCKNLKKFRNLPSQKYAHKTRLYAGGYSSSTTTTSYYRANAHY